MDFGLAKLYGSRYFTKTETTLGTVGYMSPEQASGGRGGPKNGPLVRRGGALRTPDGRVPFRGGHEVAVIHAIIYEDPAAP